MVEKSCRVHMRAERSNKEAFKYFLRSHTIAFEYESIIESKRKHALHTTMLLIQNKWQYACKVLSEKVEKNDKKMLHNFITIICFNGSTWFWHDRASNYRTINIFPKNWLTINDLSKTSKWQWTVQSKMKNHVTHAEILKKQVSITLLQFYYNILFP